MLGFLVEVQRMERNSLEMNFLRKLWKIWKDYFRKKPSQDALDQIDSTDPLARYLTSGSHFSARETR